MDEISKGSDSAVVIKDQEALAAEAQAAIERDKLDPRQQMYMLNKSTGRLIRTNAMYHRAVENHHEIVNITYKQAENLYRQEQALKFKALNAKCKRKSARNARKRNRGT